MKKLLVCCFAALGIALFAATAEAQNQKKYAVVIGNQDYTKFGKLTKTRTDANDMETALHSIGFTVNPVPDGNLQQMQAALTWLRNRLGESEDAIGFFYYSGHGAQDRNGESYLIPVDADIPSENYVGTRALALRTIHEEMSSAGNQLNIIVLDACRDFPAAWSKSTSKGLGRINYRLVNSLIVYATTPGEVAVEDSTGKNSLYTEHLLKYLTSPDLHVNEMFRRVNEDVVKASRKRQIPQINGQYFGVAVLNPAGVRPPPTPIVTGPPVPRNVRAGTPGTNSVTISWDSAGSGLSYKVYYNTRNDLFSAESLGNPTTGTSMNVSSMNSGTNYYFWVTSIQNGQESGVSSVVAIKTASVPVNPSPQQPTYKIGDRGPAGGIIFYDKGNYSNGWRYMEVAPADLQKAKWGLYEVNVTGTGTGIGDGKRNTELIIAALNRKGESGMAAQLCTAYSLNGYRDWFLPSKGELNLICENLYRKGLGDFSDSWWYWSSSQGTKDIAWNQDFSDGTQDYYFKITACLVRAVRAF